jgi:hypothetical protein
MQIFRRGTKARPPFGRNHLVSDQSRVPITIHEPGPREIWAHARVRRLPSEKATPSGPRADTLQSEGSPSLQLAQCADTFGRIALKNISTFLHAENIKYR